MRRLVGPCHFPSVLGHQGLTHWGWAEAALWALDWMVVLVDARQVLLATLSLGSCFPVSGDSPSPHLFHPSLEDRWPDTLELLLCCLLLIHFLVVWVFIRVSKMPSSCPQCSLVALSPGVGFSQQLSCSTSRLLLPGVLWLSGLQCVPLAGVSRRRCVWGRRVG